MHHRTERQGAHSQASLEAPFFFFGFDSSLVYMGVAIFLRIRKVSYTSNKYFTNYFQWMLERPWVRSTPIWQSSTKWLSCQVELVPDRRQVIFGSLTEADEMSGR